ncbi:MAG: phosphopantetheine-binding protein [bacterium]
MAGLARERIFEDLKELIASLSEDWEFSSPIAQSTFLIRDLGFESIDIVILCTNVEQRYGQTLPFSEFLAEIGQREVRDIRIDELVEFFHRHLND